MWYIYTMGYYSAIKKQKQNNAICSNMGEPRDCHKEWSKSDTEKQISYAITYAWNLRGERGTNELIYKTEVESQI